MHWIFFRSTENHQRRERTNPKGKQKIYYERKIIRPMSALRKSVKDIRSSRPLKASGVKDRIKKIRITRVKRRMLRSVASPMDGPTG